MKCYGTIPGISYIDHITNDAVQNNIKYETGLLEVLSDGGCTIKNLSAWQRRGTHQSSKELGVIAWRLMLKKKTKNKIITSNEKGLSSKIKVGGQELGSETKYLDLIISIEQGFPIWVILSTGVQFQLLGGQSKW